MVSGGKVPLRGDFSLDDCYLLRCLLGALAIRAIMLLFVAANNYRKRKPKDPQMWLFVPAGEKRKPEHPQTYWATYRDCWNGFTGVHIDMWLPFVICFAELWAYPILMRTQQFKVIGAWLAIRTAVSWHGWSRHRTSYYRFLLGTVLTLATSYFFLTRHVHMP